LAATSQAVVHTDHVPAQSTSGGHKPSPGVHVLVAPRAASQSAPSPDLVVVIVYTASAQLAAQGDHEPTHCTSGTVPPAAGTTVQHSVGRHGSLLQTIPSGAASSSFALLSQLKLAHVTSPPPVPPVPPASAAVGPLMVTLK